MTGTRPTGTGGAHRPGRAPGSGPPLRGRPFYLAVGMTLLVVTVAVLWQSGLTARLLGADGPGSSAQGPSGTPVPSGGAQPSASGPPSPPPPPECRYGQRTTRAAGYSAWKRTLLDTRLRLPATYRPPDLVKVSEAGFPGELLVRGLMVHDLAELRTAAAAAGHPIEIVAAFRSYLYQADLFARREATLGHDKAVRRTARPGHSEHQLGTAVDFKERGTRTTSVAFGTSPTGRWLLANAHRFGFVLSYPQGRQAVTCYGYEPWHYRYFGPGVAAKILASGLSTREYLWDLQWLDRKSGSP